MTLEFTWLHTAAARVRYIGTGHGPDVWTFHQFPADGPASDGPASDGPASE